LRTWLPCVLDSHNPRSIAQKILGGVKNGTTCAKWGNLDENVLNEVISVKKVKLGGKKWNLLFSYGFLASVHAASCVTRPMQLLIEQIFTKTQSVGRGTHSSFLKNYKTKF
jgi:hypothetical protein